LSVLDALNIAESDKHSCFEFATLMCMEIEEDNYLSSCTF